MGWNQPSEGANSTLHERILQKLEAISHTTMTLIQVKSLLEQEGLSVTIQGIATGLAGKPVLEIAQSQEHAGGRVCQIRIDDAFRAEGLMEHSPVLLHIRIDEAGNQATLNVIGAVIGCEQRATLLRNEMGWTGATPLEHLRQDAEQRYIDKLQPHSDPMDPNGVTGLLNSLRTIGVSDANAEHVQELLEEIDCAVFELREKCQRVLDAMESEGKAED